MDEELEQMTEVYQLVTTFLVTYSFQIIGAIIILLIGMFIARKIHNLILALCQKKQLDITLSRFIASSIRLLVIAMVGIIALNKVGISVTPLIAAIGAIGLGAGLAVQGLLSNYGAGLNIILTRPFVIGDTIQVEGVKGIVKEIHLAYTLLNDEEGVSIMVPNKHIIGEIIHNSQADSLQALSVGIAYHCDPGHAIDIIRQALTDIPGVSRDRQPLIGIDAFGDSSIDIGIRLWVATERLYECRYAANLAIHSALEKAGIEIPFPQQDIYLKQLPESADISQTPFQPDTTKGA